jgi:ribonucleoside-diphosphate reductase alpha chain
MDNVVDRTKYPLREQEREAHSKRRMGLGVTGVANALEALGYRTGMTSCRWRNRS